MSMFKRMGHTLGILLFGFALLFIAGGAIPAYAATYYVSTASGASNSNPGTQAQPWRTITYAATKAVAGDTVYIKGGSYGNEHVTVSNSGTSSNPIVFEGYDGWPILGTLPSPRTTPSSSEIGFTISSKSYITVKNLKFTWYYDCMYTYSASHITLDNLYIYSCGGATSQGDGIFLKQSTYVTVKDCTVVDCGGNNVFLDRSHYCFIDNLTTLGTLSSGNTYCTDYYCVLRACHDCTIQDSYAEDKVTGTGLPSGKGNHGFIIKDATYTPNSYNNQVSDCTAIGFEECFSVAHYAHDNKFTRCVADNRGKSSSWNVALQVRNGAHNNTFADCTATGRRVVVGMTDYSENSHYASKYGNKWINCTLKGIGQSNSIGVLFNWTGTNSFENCVFDNVQYFARYSQTNTGNSFKNCIVYNIDASYDPATIGYPFGTTAYNGTSALAVTYTDFYNNGFSAFSGTGNISANPLFASSTDYHLKSTVGRWSGSAWVTDAVDSPCIDTGDPTSAYSKEPAPNGGRINIGRYGNTTEASKSSSGGGGGGGGETVLPPRDNRLLERYPTTVYTANAFLDVGHLLSSNRMYRDLIWFDLAGYTKPVQKATLSLYWYYPSATRTNSTIVDIYRPDMGWDPAYVCWTNKASGVAWTNPGGDWYDKNSTAQGSTPYASVTLPGSQVPDNKYYSFDVTSLVNSYIQSGQNAGFFIKARTESDNYIAFHGLSATDAATYPKLEITASNSPVSSRIWNIFR